MRSLLDIEYNSIINACIYFLIVLTFYKSVLIRFNKQNCCDKKLIAW